MRFSPACSAASFAACSSVRTVVVPTATTRRSSAFARLMARAASAGISYHSVMQLVVFHFFNSHRLEGAESDVQRDLGNFDSASTNLLEDLRGEVQTGRRRRYRSPRLRIDGLVTFFIISIAIPGCCAVVAVDVGRKGHVAYALDSRKEIGDQSEPDAPLAETAAADDFGLQFGAFALERIFGRAAEVEFLSDSDLAPGPYQALPLIRIVRQLACQQNFDFSTEKIPCRRIVRAQGLCSLSAPVAVETCREDSRVVQDQQVVGPQQVGEFAKPTVFPGLRLPTLPLPIQMQQARCGAVGQRFLRYPFGRQIIVEVRDEHRGDYRVRSRSKG